MSSEQSISPSPVVSTESKSIYDKLQLECLPSIDFDELIKAAQTFTYQSKQATIRVIKTCVLNRFGRRDEIRAMNKTTLRIGLDLYHISDWSLFAVCAFDIYYDLSLVLPNVKSDNKRIRTLNFICKLIKMAILSKQQTKLIDVPACLNGKMYQSTKYVNTICIRW
jgi:hypothetical protein